MSKVSPFRHARIWIKINPDATSHRGIRALRPGDALTGEAIAGAGARAETKPKSAASQRWLRVLVRGRPYGCVGDGVYVLPEEGH